MGKFNIKNTKLKKQVGLYEAESINNAGTITIAVNPKEHFEKYKEKTVNKKQGIKKRYSRNEF